MLNRLCEANYWETYGGSGAGFTKVAPKRMDRVRTAILRFLIGRSSPSGFRLPTFHRFSSFFRVASQRRLAFDVSRPSIKRVGMTEPEGSSEAASRTHSPAEPRSHGQARRPNTTSSAESPAKASRPRLTARSLQQATITPAVSSGTIRNTTGWEERPARSLPTQPAATARTRSSPTKAAVVRRLEVELSTFPRMNGLARGPRKLYIKYKRAIRTGEIVS
jgi:hypothetical protein